MKRKILLAGLLVLPLHTAPAQARGGGSAIVTPNFANPLSSVAPRNTLVTSGQSTPLAATTNNPLTTGMSLNTGLVTGSKSPFVTPLTRPTVTTRVLTNMGNGTFSVITVSQTGGVVTFGGGTMTSVNASVLAPNVVITPQHQMTQSKVIVFQ